MSLLAIGHVLIDIRLRVSKHPATDREAEILEEKRGVGGSAANVAIVAKRLGLDSAVIAKIGLDHFGRMAAEELLKYGVDISGLRVHVARPTGFSVIAIDDKGDIVIYSYKGASETLIESDVPQDLIVRSNFVHIASLGPQLARKIVEIAKDKVISYDPGRVVSALGVEGLKDVLRYVDILLMNREEAEAVSHEKDPKVSGRKLLATGINLVVVKLGARGSLAFGDFGEVFIPSCPVERVVDTTGAGDSFAAGLMVALAKGLDFIDSLKIATATASLKITRLGSHEVPSLNDVIDYAKKRGCI